MMMETITKTGFLFFDPVIVIGLQTILLGWKWHIGKLPHMLPYEITNISA
jgi:hypothetical protein